MEELFQPQPNSTVSVYCGCIYFNLRDLYFAFLTTYITLAVGGGLPLEGAADSFEI